MLLAERGHLCLVMVHHVAWRANLGADLRVQTDQPATQLERGFDLDGLHRPEAVVPLELFDGGSVEPGQAPEFGDQPVREVQHVARATARAQNDRQQLGERQGLRPRVQQPLPWPDRLGQLLQPDSVLDRSWRGDCSTPAAGGSTPKIGAIITLPKWRVASSERRAAFTSPPSPLPETERARISPPRFREAGGGARSSFH